MSRRSTPAIPSMPACPACGGRIVPVKCKLVCERCRAIVENCSGD